MSSPSLSLPATSPPPPSPPHPTNVVEPWDPDAHSAYYIDEILIWFKMLLIFTGFMLFAYAVLWALQTDVPYVGKLVLAGIAFSQILQCKKIMRRMRNLNRRRVEDLEEGVGEGGEEIELEERGKVLGKEDDRAVEGEGKGRGRSLARKDGGI